MDTPNLTHRPATDDDLRQVVDFVQTPDELFFAYPKGTWPLTVEQLAAARAERRGSTLALLDGRPAGYANFYQWHPGESCALGNLMIAPWARSRGVARYLIDVMERQAREHFDARRLDISCFNANAAGLLLYTRLGYTPKEVVERSDPQGQRVALIRLEKALG